MARRRVVTPLNETVEEFQDDLFNDMVFEDEVEAVVVEPPMAFNAPTTKAPGRAKKATATPKEAAPVAPAVEAVTALAPIQVQTEVVIKNYVELTSFESVYALSTDYTFAFIVLGCGGTGSYLVPNIARLISTMNTDKGTQHKMILCDGDVVEPKNINRQNFIASDVTKNKAEVLANRYSTSFNIPIEYATEYIEKAEQLRNLVRAGRNFRPTNGKAVAYVIVGCVDTHKVRKMIHAFCETEGFGFWLDSGNEQFAGQVVLGHFAYNYNIPKKGLAAHQDPNKTWLFDLPNVAQLYPDVLTSEDKFASELSCAERAVSNPQSIATNILAATILFGFINNLIGGRIDYHAVTFNSQIGNTRTTYNTMDVIQKYGTTRGREKMVF